MARQTLADVVREKTASRSVLFGPWPYFLAGVIVLAVAVWAMVTASMDATRNQAPRVEAQQVAQSLGQAVEDIAQMLRSEAVQTLAEQVAEGDEPSLAPLLAEMRRQVPQVRDVRIYGDDVFLVDLDTLGEQPYIVLDMMAEAQEDELAAVQFLREGSLDYLAAASTIGRAVQGKGYLLALLNPDDFLDRFSIPNPAAGYIALEHGTGVNAPVTLKRFGSEMPVGFATQRLLVPGSRLQVAYPASTKKLLVGGSEQGVLFVLAALFLLLGVMRYRAVKPTRTAEATMPDRFVTLREGSTQTQRPPTLADTRRPKTLTTSAPDSTPKPSSPGAASDRGDHRKTSPTPPSPGTATIRDEAPPTKSDPRRSDDPAPGRVGSDATPPARPAAPSNEPGTGGGAAAAPTPAKETLPEPRGSGAGERSARSEPPTSGPGTPARSGEASEPRERADDDASTTRSQAHDGRGDSGDGGGGPQVGRISDPGGDELEDFSAFLAQRAAERRAAGEDTERAETAPDDTGSSDVPGSNIDADSETVPATTAPPAPPAPSASVDGDVPLKSSIFRAYDIRGIVGETLDRSVAFLIGQAVGSLAQDSLAGTVVVGRDGRHSGPELAAGLMEGLVAAGCTVIDAGAVPTGALYYAAWELGKGSGVMVTGSHNPPNYNGFKIMIAGRTLAGDDIFGLFERIRTGTLRTGKGQQRKQAVLDAYRHRIAGDIKLERPLKVVADCGNGIGGVSAPQVLRAIGAEVVPLFEEVDGDFPNHHPDPSEPENLEDLIESVRMTGADLGLAFDGDADRLGVVTPDGKIVFADRIMMLYAREVLSRKPGAKIIYDVKCTGHLDRVIREAGGEPEMYKTGHSLMKNRMKEAGAPLAGEMSGHFFFEDRWYGFDCGIYSACRLLEILAREEDSPAEVLGALPNSVSTPELKVELEEGENHRFMERFRKEAEFTGARVTTIDGVRADFDEGWGLVRASNTTPILVLRFDADSEEALDRVKEVFRAQLLALKPDLVLPF